MNLDGILNLYKPSGPTSMDMVRITKRVTGQKKIGHGGTLDPLASGVLPICFGQATKFVQYLINGSKVYKALIRMGVVTDSFDGLGNVTKVKDSSMITKVEVLGKLGQFIGNVYQIPPMFSALKINGQRLYKLARLGEEVERSPREVTISRIELIDWNPPEFTLEIECGRGVYIRSLAYDLGESLGCGAFLKELTRLRAGPFSICDSTSPEELKLLAVSDSWNRCLSSPDAVLKNLKFAVVPKETEYSFQHGRKIALSMTSADQIGHRELCRVYNSEGRFLGLVNFDSSDKLWQPKIVLDSKTDLPG